jgi:hypothetical protein
MSTPVEIKLTRIAVPTRVATTRLQAHSHMAPFVGTPLIGKVASLLGLNPISINCTTGTKDPFSDSRVVYLSCSGAILSSSLFLLAFIFILFSLKFHTIANFTEPCIIRITITKFTKINMVT